MRPVKLTTATIRWVTALLLTAVVAFELVQTLRRREEERKRLLAEFEEWAKKTILQYREKGWI